MSPFRPAAESAVIPSVQPIEGSQIGRGTTKPRRGAVWELLTLAVLFFLSEGGSGGANQKEKEQERLSAKAIIAERFEVRAADGSLRALLSKDARGRIYLKFMDAAGHARLALGLTEDGAPRIALSDDTGAVKIDLSIDPKEGTPQLIMLDRQNEPAISLGTLKGFGPHMIIGKHGENQILIQLQVDGSPSIDILDAQRNPRLALSVSGNEPLVSLMGNNRVPRATLRVLTDGSASLALSDAQATERLVVATDKEGRPSIRFLNPDKTVAKEFK